MDVSAVTKQKPHVPTLVLAILAVVILLGLYHLAAGRRRRG